MVRGSMGTRGQRWRMLATNCPIFLHTGGTGIDVGQMLFRGQQMPLAEHVERQIAAVVIAVKETPFPVSGHTTDLAQNRSNIVVGPNGITLADAGKVNAVVVTATQE